MVKMISDGYDDIIMILIYMIMWDNGLKQNLLLLNAKTLLNKSANCSKTMSAF